MLSESALALLRRRASGEGVPVSDETLPAYRRTVGAGIMISGHSFTLGRGERIQVHGSGLELRYRDMARRIRLAPSVIGNSVFAAAFKAASCVT